MTTPYPTGTYQQPPQENGTGTAALVLGIVGLVCIPVIPSILAIVFGRMGITKAEQGLANNKSSAQWGFWLGIVGLVLNVLGAIGWIALIAIDSAS
jgi:hypothetical protein